MLGRVFMLLNRLSSVLSPDDEDISNGDYREKRDSEWWNQYKKNL
jgi:hypothetical protein